MKFAASRLRIPSLVLAITALTLAGTVWLPQGLATQSAAAQGLRANPASCPAPANIPAGFDYPKSAATIKGWVNTRNIAQARVHGWNLWAALNTMAGKGPVWQSWCTETQAFGPPTLFHNTLGAVETSHGSQPLVQFERHNGLKDGPDPINFPNSPVYPIPKLVMDRYKGSGCILPPSDGQPASLANGPTLQNNGDVMIAGVIYNQPAYEWIRKEKLYESSVLHGMMPKKGGQASIKDLPPGSISLKPMMWPVKAGGFTALPLWDHPASDNGVYAGFEIQSKWPRAVAVTPTPQSTVVPASVSYLYGVQMAPNSPPKQPLKPLGPNTYKNPRVVGVQEFYNYRPDLKTMATCDRAILDASAYYAYGRMFEQGDYLILIAMHIMTKEQPDWTFQSVWWHDRPDAGPYAADRPNLPNAKGPWAHYLMASTYGISATPGGKTWPLAYNPYIELAADHPIVTNCMNCHHRAAWPHTPDEYLAPGGPGALDIFTQKNPTIFDSKLAVDSLWSISDRVPVGPTTIAPKLAGKAETGAQQ